MTALLWAVYQSTNHQIAPALARACADVADVLKPLTQKAEAERERRQSEEMRRRKAETERSRKVRETKAKILADKDWMQRVLAEKEARGKRVEEGRIQKEIEAEAEAQVA
jgi:hypothetical protein